MQITGALVTESDRTVSLEGVCSALTWIGAIITFFSNQSFFM